MNLKLSRPLCFIDAETCTVKSRPDAAVDRIICLAMTKIWHDEPQSEDYKWEFNPGIPISDENSAIHGYTNASVSAFPAMTTTHAKDIQDFISGCDLAGFGILNYDLPLLWESLYRIGVELKLNGVNVIDSSTIMKKMEERTLTAAMKFYCGLDHSGAHGAVADVQATINVLEAQIIGQKVRPTESDGDSRIWCDPAYAELSKMSVAELAAFSRMDDRIDLFGTIVRNKDGVPVFNTKRNQGVPVTSDVGYAEWFLRNDFPANIKRVIEKILDGEFEAEPNDLFKQSTH